MTSTDTLTRWLPLWQTDESLRPEELHWAPLNRNFFIVNKSGHHFWEGAGLPTAALIRDSAVRWLTEKAWEPCIMPDGSLTLEASFGARSGGPFAGPLDDALY